MLIQTFAFSMARRVGALLLGGIILWQVVDRCGATRGQAIVHVSMPQVEVRIDDQAYWVETLWATPIVCELRPGHHRLRMLRSGRVLYEEEFTLAAGEERILAAWDGYRDGRSPEEAR
jgi:hypothetical protein